MRMPTQGPPVAKSVDPRAAVRSLVRAMTVDYHVGTGGQPPAKAADKWRKDGKKWDSPCLKDPDGDARIYKWTGSKQPGRKPDHPVVGTNLFLYGCDESDAPPKERRCKIEHSPARPCPT